MKLKSLENIYDEFTRTEKREEVHEKYEDLLLLSYLYREAASCAYAEARADGENAKQNAADKYKLIESKIEETLNTLAGYKKRENSEGGKDD